MGAHRFTPGTRFHWKGSAYEVIRLRPENKVEIEGITVALLREVPLSELVTALFSGELQLMTRDALATSPSPNPPRLKDLDLSDYPANAVAIAHYRFTCLQPLLALPPEQCTRAVVEARAQEIRVAHPSPPKAELRQAISAASLYRWLKAYQEAGDDLRALIPNTRQRGGKGQTRLGAEVNAIIDQAIQTLCRVREKSSLEDLLHEVAARLVENNQLRPPSESLPLPSKTTLARRVSHWDIRERFAVQHGSRAARRQFKQLSQRSNPQLPLEQVEIDHTKADLIVIDDEDDLPLGRFTLTYSLDLCTRYPLGFYMGFEPPGYYPVLECLYHTICPKENYQEKYGTTHDWAAYGLPSLLKVDNGKDFISQSLDDACLSLGMILNRAPVKTPEFKAGIERYFGSLNTMLLHQLPGTTFSNFQQRGDYDSQGQACISLKDVERMMVKYVVDIYAERPHRGLDGGIPARQWEAALRAGLAPRVPASRQEALILLGRVTYRTVSPSGIEFARLHYNAPELALLRQQLKGQDTKIKYHPGDLSRVYVFDPFENDYIEARACDPEGYTQNLSLWKHQVIRAYLRSRLEKPDLAALGRAKREIRDLVQEAKGRKKQRTRSKIARWQQDPPSLEDQRPVLAKPPETDPTLSTSEPRPAVLSLPLELPSTTEPLDEGWALTFNPPHLL